MRRTVGMTSSPGKLPRREMNSESESDNESVSSEEEHVKSRTLATDFSSEDVTDVSGYTLNLDVEGDESPVIVPKAASGIPSKSAGSCWHDSLGDKDASTVTHRHTEKLIRRPLHKGSARTKDSYIEYTSQCTVVSKHEESVGISRNVHLLLALVLICALCLVSAVFSVLQQPRSLESDPYSKSVISSEMFLRAFNGVKESFPVQTSGFWGIIRAAIKPILLQENPDQPAVFVLVVPSDARETAACFIRLFSNAVTSLSQRKSAVEFRTDAVSGLPPERVKRLLDDQLNHGLVSGSPIAVVHHLEQLHGESAMMLHAYCDNENAPFRRAIFVLVLNVDETSSEVSETEMFVEQRLKQLWGDSLGTNRFPPLITRIAHSIVFMRPESSDVLSGIDC